MVSGTSKPEALAVAKASGRKVIREWIANGTLVDEAAAARRGADGRRADSIVTFRHDGQVYYLACVLDLPVDAVQWINAALGSADNAARVLWWTRRHGALSATTVPDAIRAGRVERCVELAQAYAEEHGDVEPGGMDQ